MTSTLPISRSGGIAVPNIRHFQYDGVGAAGSVDDWGPSSVPPTKQSTVPWDEQVVPALRKKLEEESQKLTKRISRIEDSDHGWSANPSRLRDSFDHRELSIDSSGPTAESQPVAARPSRGLVQHGRTSSIEQYHNRFGSLRRARNDENSGTPSNYAANTAAKTGALSALDRNALDADQQWSWPTSHQAAGNNEIMNKDKSTQSAARQRELSHDKPYNNIPEGYSWQPLGTPPKESNVAAQTVAQTGSNQGAQRFRPRTKSTPMQPSSELSKLAPPLDFLATPEAERLAKPHQDGQEQQLYSSTKESPRHTPSSARRKVELDPKLIEEFGPLGSSPSGHYSPSDLASKRYRTAQPDAFLSLSPERLPRSRREVSAPAAIGDLGGASEFGTYSPSGAKRGNDWEEQIVPTVARRLRQQQLLEQQGRLSRYEGLIDRWDKDGNPLSINGDIVPRKLSQPLPITEQASRPPVQPEPTMLSAMDSTVDRSSRHSQQSARYRSHTPVQETQNAAETQDIPMQPISATPAQARDETQAQYTATAPGQTQTGVTAKQTKSSVKDDDTAGCCCIVM